MSREDAELLRRAAEAFNAADLASLAYLVSEVAASPRLLPTRAGVEDLNGVGLWWEGLRGTSPTSTARAPP